MGDYTIQETFEGEIEEMIKLINYIHYLENMD